MYAPGTKHKANIVFYFNSLSVTSQPQVISCKQVWAGRQERLAIVPNERFLYTTCPIVPSLLVLVAIDSQGQRSL